MKMILHLLRRPAFIIAVVLLLSAVLAGFWFIRNFERKPFDITTGISAEARINAYLAAQRYFEAMGIPTTSVASLDPLINLPPAGDAIFLPRWSTALSEGHTDALFRWIRNGGHLITTPTWGDDADDLAAGWFGVSYLPWEDPRGCEEDAETSAETEQDDQQDELYDTPRLIEFEQGGHRLVVEHHGATLLRDQGGSALLRIVAPPGDDQANSDDITPIWLVRYQVGDGTVTFMSETAFATNHHINDHDHAYLLALLVGDPEKLWLIYRGDVEPFISMVYKKAPLFWVSSLAGLVLLVWAAQRSTGPPKVVQPSPIHSVLTHVRATGNFHWRIGALSAIINDTLEGWPKSQSRDETRDDAQVEIINRYLEKNTNQSGQSASPKMLSEESVIQLSRAMQTQQKTRKKRSGTDHG
jgi:hypothetical protein